MADAIPEIDTSVLDDLVAIRHEQAQLVQFRARAEEMKAKVDARVYERVVGDYDRREATLLDRASPLEARARVEFRKLRARDEEVTQTRRTAEFDKAEIEFRHSVGEIDDAELAERIKAPETVLAACQSELEALQALKARFVDAYATVDADSAEPEAPAVSEPAPPAVVEPPDEAPAESPELAMAAEPEPEAEPAAPPAQGPPPLSLVPDAMPADEPPPPPAEVPFGSATGEMPAWAATGEQPPEAGDEAGLSGPSLAFHQAPTQMFEVPNFARPAEPPEPPPPQAPPPVPEPAGEHDTDGDVTFILPDAVLVDASHGTTEFRLGAMNYIGRADDNQIRLKSGDISRRHAMISVANGAYLLRDLQSQNGTFVNGQRIAEHVLADGDRVRVGNIELVFHYASPNRDADSGSGIAWATPGS